MQWKGYVGINLILDKMKKEKKNPELERIIKEGYEFTKNWDDSGSLKEYGKGQHRIVYDLKHDVIRTSYTLEVEE